MRAETVSMSGLPHIGLFGSVCDRKRHPDWCLKVLEAPIDLKSAASYICVLGPGAGRYGVNTLYGVIVRGLARQITGSEYS
jgi:hypothetical protein